jgi:hypothetical protein
VQAPGGRTVLRGRCQVRVVRRVADRTRPYGTWSAGNSQAVEQADTLGLAEAQDGRDTQLKAQPNRESVYRSCPTRASHLAGRRAKCRAATCAGGPVSRLDKPAALLARRPTQQRAYAARPLAAESLRRSFFPERQLGRDHPHSRHRHRADHPARSATKHVASTSVNVHSSRAPTLHAPVPCGPGSSRRRVRVAAGRGAGEPTVPRRAVSESRHAPAETATCSPRQTSMGWAVRGLQVNGSGAEPPKRAQHMKAADETAVCTARLAGAANYTDSGAGVR